MLPQINSRVQNSISNAFQKSHKDRFRITGAENPAGAEYSPKANLNENIKSQYKFVGATKFGRETRTFIDQNWDPKDKMGKPAPGAYNSFSDFDGMSK